jgi:hypothetical protein
MEKKYSSYYTWDFITIAKSHIGKGDMVSSAQLCCDDAYALFMEQKFDQAKERALKSIAYSVGIFHEDYILLKNEI